MAMIELEYDCGAKFKPGDKLHVIPDIARHVGEIVTIDAVVLDISFSRKSYIKYRIKEDGGKYYWTACMFEEGLGTMTIAQIKED